MDLIRCTDSVLSYGFGFRVSGLSSMPRAGGVSRIRTFVRSFDLVSA